MRKSLLLAATLVFGLPAAWQAAAQNAPSVTVRAGAHPDFDRIVFDWPRNVHFELHRDGTQASITFDATADIKFTRDVQSYLTRAKAFSAKSENGHVIVSFTVRPDSTLKSFNGDGSSVVIDVSGKMAGAAMTDPAVQTPQVAARPLPSSPAKTPQTTPTPAPAAPIAAPLAKPVTAATPVALISALASPHPATTPTASPLTTLKNDAPPLVPPPVASPHNTLSDEPVLVATLDPHVPTRAAIFLRADIGYIVFDRKLTLSVAALENGTPSNVNIESFDMPRNSGYRFAVPPNAELHASLDGTVWKIFLSRKHPDAPVTTALVAQPDFALGARFLLPLPDAPDPIRMTDPVVGDDLILVPLAQSEAFNVQRYTANLTLLPAAQGLVIKPLTDKVIVRAVSDGVEITAEGGLLMSRAIDTGIISQSSSKAKAAASGKSIFDFATWAGKPGESFTETRQRLQQTIVDVPDAERNRARLELARFYFANGNGEEAAALLNFLLKQVPDLRSHSDFSALLGASEILAYHSEDGLHELSATALSDQPEIELWQAVGLAQMRDWPHAEEKFAARENVLTGYPEPFISRFFVMAIESAVATDKQHEATDWLDYIASAPHSEDIDPALAYLRGALHAKAGRAAAAEDSWKEAAASKDRLYQMRAELALIDLGVSTASLTPAQAADRLEALRFGWRGDDLEVDILHRLGTYYIEAKNVKQGLNALAQAVTLYPSSPLVPEIRAEMQAAFHNVFLGDLGKKISPLDSLTLFQQYRDLMPEGKDGDAVMRNLAERLVAVDLLDQASELLEALAKYRLQGEDKDRAALRLAGIRLLDHKPTESQAALDIIGNDTLPADLLNERTLLRARALSELHRDDEAAALLKDNATPAAKMLRADIAMHAKKWGDAGKALMELVGPPPAEGTPLSAAQAKDLINAAIAYALADDQPGLDKLGIDYSAAMATQPQNDTFLMLTRPEKTGQLRDLMAAQAQITQVDMFQGFLNNYRQAPANGAAVKKQP